jgi:F420-dependent oxidoreductase-like protein
VPPASAWPAPATAGRPLIRFGYQVPRVSAAVPGDRLFEHLARVCELAERSGFDSVWAMDHVMLSGDGMRDPMPEAYTLLSALAGRTERVRLGTLVAPVTFREPALLAKIVTTLDVISGGRAVLGVGAGWNEDEHRRYGLPFPALPERMRRLEDTLAIARAMFHDELASHRGHHRSIDDAVNSPRPLRGAIPILVGGDGERRTLALVARYADACNLTVGDPADVRHKLGVLDRHCEAIGRDPASITRTRAAGLVVATTSQRAARAGEAMRAALGMERERFERYAIVGSPDQVREGVRACLEAGIDGLICNIPDELGADGVALAGETLLGALG